MPMASATNSEGRRLRRQAARWCRWDRSALAHVPGAGLTPRPSANAAAPAAAKITRPTITRPAVAHQADRLVVSGAGISTKCVASAAVAARSPTLVTTHDEQGDDGRPQQQIEHRRTRRKHPVQQPPA